jgi:choline dehydrogenase-like flavoprotein
MSQAFLPLSHIWRDLSIQFFPRFKFQRGSRQSTRSSFKRPTSHGTFSFCNCNADAACLGTVRMGKKDDKGACVDPDFRVRGVENLRVVDLSVIPLLPK